MVLGELEFFKRFNDENCLSSAIEWQRLIPKDKLVVQAFHMSPVINRNSIKKYGLMPHSKPVGTLSYPPAVFISLTVEDLPWGYYGNQQMDIWSFCVLPKYLIPDKNSSGKPWFYLTDAVPFYKLHISKTIHNLYNWGMETT